MVEHLTQCQVPKSTARSTFKGFTGKVHPLKSDPGAESSKSVLKQSDTVIFLKQNQESFWSELNQEQ